MTQNSNDKHLRLWTPATYRIEVEGHLDESRSDRLAGMRRARDVGGGAGIAVGSERRLLEEDGLFQLL
mgnify:CR=1 FL=1